MSGKVQDSSVLVLPVITAPAVRSFSITVAGKATRLDDRAFPEGDIHPEGEVGVKQLGFLGMVKADDAEVAFDAVVFHEVSAAAIDGDYIWFGTFGSGALKYDGTNWTGFTPW